ncbi:hypothetical protein [Pseudalkalibacillus hwajinpoensis]|uniref:DUF3139 domain-containing protein n=1 Tax=Guptibacillus hwajinpoensis TaxID=208199 RepID=A0A4V5PZ30_9BACL|nr:hypothetical protein [Pseudalkalibacillus hwajinpoensis]TKD72338.1 hypothetical protein FBF83_06025 [Pseudalkalibacillus hwajinpoensis]
MKKIAIGTGLLFVVLFMMFGPYKVINEMNERGALKEFISSHDTFKGEEIMEIDYRGSDTYFVQTNDGEEVTNYIVMNYKSSMMNGHWKVFEESGREHYY